jgi:predicted butyrate kinase (DUF1464 family)
MSEKKHARLLRIAAAAVGAAFVAAGLWQGQYEAVLQKAVRICLECIGIG